MYKIILTSFLLVSISESMYSKEKINDNTVVLSTGEWKPYHSESLRHGGFGNHVISEAFELSGYNVKFEWYPWKRAILASRPGRVDGVAVWGGYVDWLHDNNGSDEIYSSEATIFHRKGENVNWQDPKDMDGKVVGILSSDKLPKDIGHYKYKEVHKVTSSLRSPHMC
jgi:hypothetical protein